MATLNKAFITVEYYLIDNRIGDAGAESIAEALKTNTTLTELILGSMFFFNQNHTSVAISDVYFFFAVIIQRTLFHRQDRSCLLVL